MNQESERVLSKVGELVEKEKLNPKQQYLRVKEPNFLILNQFG